MTQSIPESDWKLFRQLHPIALNRFCDKVLRDIATISGDAKATPHERYLRIYKVIHQRDRTIADAFNDLRRSTAILRLISICSHKLITEDEIARFSEGTRDSIARFSA